MNPRPSWSEPDKARMVAMRDAGETFAAVAAEFKTGERSVNKVVARYRRRLARMAAPPTVAPSRASVSGHNGGHDGWSERALTEPWANYTARKKAERAARAQAAQPMEMAA